MAKPYKPLPKSRSNTSGRPSEAKRMASQSASAKKGASAPARPYKLKAPEPKPARQLPETDATRKGLSLRKLLRGTPRLMVANAAHVDIVSFKKTSTKSGMPAIKASCISLDPFRPAKIIRKHSVYIIGAERDAEGNPLVNKSVNKHSKVLVSCGCENFMYTWEYANAANGASRIIYCNGEPPVVTNPSLAFGLCKHLVAVAQHIISRDL